MFLLDSQGEDTWHDTTLPSPRFSLSLSLSLSGHRRGYFADVLNRITQMVANSSGVSVIACAMLCTTLAIELLEKTLQRWMIFHVLLQCCRGSEM